MRLLDETERLLQQAILGPLVAEQDSDYDYSGKDLVPNTILNPDFWHGERLKDEIAQHIYMVGQRFVDFLSYTGLTLEPIDIIFTGSLCNYNYSQYSDVDTHCILDFTAVADNTDLVNNYFQSKKASFNEHHHITICGFEAELYPQNINDVLDAGGIYSVKTHVLNKDADPWIAKPQSPTSTTVDIAAVYSGARKLMQMIDYAVDHKDLTAVSQVKSKIAKYRKAGLDKGGEMSLENLAFKVLRRNGYMEKLYNTAPIEDASLSYP